MTSPPSKMTMMSLAFDSEFRGAIEKVRLHTPPFLLLYSAGCLLVFLPVVLLFSYCRRGFVMMVGWDELVVDDRTEERWGGRHTRSESLFSLRVLPSFFNSLSLRRSSP